MAIGFSDFSSPLSAYTFQPVRAGFTDFFSSVRNTLYLAIFHIVQKWRKPLTFNAGQSIVSAWNYRSFIQVLAHNRVKCQPEWIITLKLESAAKIWDSLYMVLVMGMPSVSCYLPDASQKPHFIIQTFSKYHCDSYFIFTWILVWKKLNQIKYNHILDLYTDSDGFRNHLAYYFISVSVCNKIYSLPNTWGLILVSIF